MPIYDDYAEYTQQAKRDYGSKTLVLMEVGSFWELYDCDQHLGADMDAIGQLLGIQISRKNKSIPEVSRTNPQMAGFPTHALGRFQPLLLDAGYTIVYVGQITAPPNPKRGITKVVSKGTYVDPSIESPSIAGGGLATLYLCPGAHKAVLAAVAMLEVSTGRSIVYETSSHESLYRFLYAQRPVEMVVFGGASSTQTHANTNTWIEVITRACHEQAVVHMRCGDTDYAKPYEDSAYQNQVLRKVFYTGSGSGQAEMGMLTPIEYLDLERHPFLVVAYTALLQFAYAHDETILARLQKPMLETDANLLQLCYNASQQLDLQGLDRLLNTCVTAMGRRAFTRQLTHPIYDTKQLEQRYDTIDAMRQPHQSVQPQEPVFIQVRSHLAKIYDLERLFRRVYMQTAEPHHLRSIIQSLAAGKEAMAAIACLPEPGNSSRAAFQRMHAAQHGIDDILAFFDQHLVEWDSTETAGTLEDIVEAAAGAASQPQAMAFFRPGLYPELDALQQAYRQPLQDIQAVCQCVQDQVPQACLKLECNDRDGYYYVLTQKRFKDFQTQLKACTVTSVNGRELAVADLLAHATTTGTTTKLAKCSWLNVLNERLQEAREAFRRQLRAVYARFLTELSDQLASRSEAILELLCQMDMAASMAKQAEAYAYVRPVLMHPSDQNNDGCCSSMDAKGIRHPIIERVHDQVPYVANDVAIGGPEYGPGILLYGLNAAGKSSLMKAVGLNILLAQAGFFVAATQFTLCPYRKLYTRITHQDDLYRGQSTFMVEMSELRSILKGADPWSIVLGDELCSGTEAISATAIVAAGIATLCKRQVSFLFATHLHDLLEVEAVQQCVHHASTTPPALRVYHLHVEYDAQTDKLVYDRTLKPGEGHRLYGLEVCKSLGMDAEFMRLADHIRRIRTGVPEAILPTKKSRYNAKLFVDQHCAVCKAHDKSIEVHHITEQHTFRKISLGTSTTSMSKQKNRLSNMVCLCSACHDALHSGKINIHGYRQTSDGIALDVEDSRR